MHGGITRVAAITTMVAALALPAAAQAEAGLAPAGGAPLATSAVDQDTLVNYRPPFRLKAQRRVTYFGVCSLACDVTATTSLTWPGPDVKPVTVGPATFPAGQVFQAYLELTKVGAAYLKENKKKAKLVTRISATDPLTGNTDTDTRAFRFK